MKHGTHRRIISDVLILFNNRKTLFKRSPMSRGEEEEKVCEERNGLWNDILMKDSFALQSLFDRGFCRKRRRREFDPCDRTIRDYCC